MSYILLFHSTFLSNEAFLANWNDQQNLENIISVLEFEISRQII